MLLRDLRIAFVIPQQSLRKSVQKVFRKTLGLHPSMVLTAFDVGESEQDFDLLIVDETLRPNQRANQPPAALNTNSATSRRSCSATTTPRRPSSTGSPPRAPTRSSWSTPRRA
ncbi:hypothetical protein ACEXQB_012265 [Herbiconiux sp. P18]|uniref:hypothetical protein n=1 Tax=Herbiconiux liangxiaofengii TaxID=3342795 RepID=UPI0035B99B81